MKIDWPKFHFDLANTGYNAAESHIGPGNVSTLVQVWVARTGAVRGAIALNGGVLYVSGTTFQIPVATVVSAIDGKTGALIWRHRVRNAGAIYGLCYADGSVFFGTDDHVLHALDARTGRSRWDALVGGVPANPVVANGLVYYGDTDGVVHAADVNTGVDVWTFQDSGTIIGSTPAIVNGILYIGTWDAKVYALNSLTGVLIWSFETSKSISRSAPAISGGIVYVHSDDTFLYALDAATGVLQWRVKTGPQLFQAPPSPAVANGVVYASEDGVVQAFSTSNGTRLWKTLIADGTGSPVVANRVVYVPGGDEGTFQALDAESGTALWSFTAENFFVDGGEIVANGMIYAGSIDGNLYAFALPG